MPGLMLYDADCGFCAATAAKVPGWGIDVEVRALQSVDLAAYGVDPVRAERDMPFVAADGRVSYGHRAWAAVLQQGRLPARLLGRLLGARLFAPVGARIYRWVSTHRSRLPGGTAACELPAQGRDDTAAGP